MLRFACMTATLVAHPAAILLFPILCGLWLICGGSVDGLTLVLSVLAISLTQLVLMSSDHDTKAIHKKLGELIHVNKDADDSIAEIEKEIK